MSPDSRPCGCMRSRAALNEAIRDLLRLARGRRMSAEEQARYERLRAEWVKAA